MVREPFRLTTGRWYNHYDPETERYAKAPCYKAGFTYGQFAYGQDYPATFLPAGDETLVQRSLICSKATKLLVIDIDYPGQLAGSATGQLVSWQDAISVRGSHFHVGIDMRGVPDADWPVQGRTTWGDVKSNGFVAAPGSVHYSGEQYAPASAAVAEKLVPATPELLAALNADRNALREANRKAWGLGTGSYLADGSYSYDSGYIGGSWEAVPDGGLVHDDQLKDLLFDMHVRYGREEAECREQWHRLAGALGKPWTERDFARHWRKVPAMRLEELEKDNFFGFEPELPAVEAEAQRQHQEYAAAPAAGRPVPPPGWGFEVPGVDYFPMWLGGGTFDAGRRATDADNALAVLARAHNVLRYDEEAGTWLLRGTGRWESLPGAAGPRAVVNGLRDLMPEGCADPVKALDKDPEADGPEIAALKVQAKNRERFSASSSVGQVAAVMTDTVLRHRGSGVTARSSKLDTDAEILWAGGVPWDLRKSADGPVASGLDRSTPHLMTAPVVPDLSVPTPLWDAYCRAVFPDLPREAAAFPEQGREWALEVLAAAFTGYADAVMPVLLGETRLGKTFLVNLLTSVLGDYGGIMSGDLLKADARLHGSFTLKLKGMRLAFVDEAPGKGQASQEHLKKITGGGKMEGNKMRENPVEFFPTHTLVLAANLERMPVLTEDALRTRARVIKFEGDRAAVKAAAAALGGSVSSAAWQAEMPGVLAQMMARAARWLADRSIADTERSPQAWQYWADDTIAEQDPVKAWLACGELVPDPHGTPSATLHEHFYAWCKRHGVSGTVPELVAFGIALTKLGYTGRKSNGVMWRPLRIAQPGVGEWLGGASPNGATLPATLQTQNPSSSTAAASFREGRESRETNKTHKEATHTPYAYKEGIGAKPSTLPETAEREGLQPSDLLEYEKEASGGSPSLLPDPPAGAGTPPLDPPAPPVAPETGFRPETGENDFSGKKHKTPPKAKNPKLKLTPEERLERDLAKKAAAAQARAGARLAKVAELGGRPVKLPAVVLRDQSILEVDAGTARRWLEPCLAELSVDVEHTGYPAQHKDYRLRLVQLGNEGSAVVFDPQDEAQAEVIRWALEAAGTLHAHSALADLVPLEREGLGTRAMWRKLRDTVILAKLLDPGLTDSDEAALKPLAKSVLGDDYALSWACDKLKGEIFAAGGWLVETEVTTPVERSGWAQVPVCEAFVRYAASDVMDCAAVHRVLSERAGL